MEDKNEVILIGTIASDIQLRTSAKGTPWVSFRINTTCKGMKHFNNVMAFKDNATGICNQLHNGDRIKIIANVGISQNKKNNTWNTNITVFHFEALANDPSNTEVQKKMDVPEKAKAEVPSADGNDLPF
jgi:single-stranded DNA-binding protein